METAIIPKIILTLKALRNLIEEFRDADIDLYNRTIEESKDLEVCIEDLSK